MTVKSKPKPKRKSSKFSGGAKTTLAALSVISFFGGWNIVAHVDGKNAQAAPEPAPPEPVVQTMPAVVPTSTPWPDIAPLPELPPIPTLAPLATAGQANGIAPAAANPVNLSPQTTMQLAPMPAPAPLPTLAPLPAMPAMPQLPPPPVFNGGGGKSGGS